MSAEVKRGELQVNGKVLPLRKGIILVALAKAGWAGRDGVLSEDLIQRMFRADPRVAFVAEPTAFDLPSMA